MPFADDKETRITPKASDAIAKPDSFFFCKSSLSFAQDQVTDINPFK